MTDSLILEVRDYDVDVLTGIYSDETKLPQPLRFTIRAEMAAEEHYDTGTHIDATKNYMDLKAAASEWPEGVHFPLVEAVADHVIDRIMGEDERVLSVEVKIVKLAISERGEAIGITLKRSRRP